MKKSFTAIAVAVLTGIASTHLSAAPVTVPLHLEASAEILEVSRSAETLLLQVGVIPGSLYGTPLEKPLWHIDLGAEADATLDIGRLEQDVEPFAAPLDSHSLSRNFSIVPEDTLILRISTFGVDLAAQTYLNGALTGSDNNLFMLVYFSKACELTGTFHSQREGTIHHQVKVPEPGLYRLVFHRVNDETIVKAHKSLEPIHLQLW